MSRVAAIILLLAAMPAVACDDDRVVPRYGSQAWVQLEQLRATREQNRLLRRQHQLARQRRDEDRQRERRYNTRWRNER